jgi:hypothetical protein
MGRFGQVDGAIDAPYYNKIGGTLDRANEFVDRGMPLKLGRPGPARCRCYFRGEKFAGTRILLYWLTIIACALGRNA